MVSSLVFLVCFASINPEKERKNGSNVVFLAETNMWYSLSCMSCVSLWLLFFTTENNNGLLELSYKSPSKKNNNNNNFPFKVIHSSRCNFLYSVTILAMFDIKCRTILRLYTLTSLRSKYGTLIHSGYLSNFK